MLIALVLGAVITVLSLFGTKSAPTPQLMEPLKIQAPSVPESHPLDMYKSGFDDARAGKPRHKYNWLHHSDYRRGYRHGLWGF